MIVHRLTMENFCQHKSLAIEMTAGLNMLVGPNGAGKTNILRALKFALTGDAGGDRTKADDIYQGIQPNESSYVEAEISHGGVRMVVRRSLRPATNTLTIGDQTLTAVSEINAELWRRLGTTKKQITDYIFVGQRKIDEMFDQRPADRAASLAALFGIAQAEKVYKKIGEFINSIEVPTTLIDEDAAKAAVKTQEQALCEITQAIEALSMPEDPAAYIAEQSVITNGYSALFQKDADLQAAVNNVAAKAHECGAAEVPIASFDGKIHGCQSVQLNMADAVALAEEGLQQWRTYNAIAQTKAQWESDLQAAMTTRSALQMPPVPTVAPLSDEQAQTLTSLEYQHTQLATSIQGLQNATTVCPTCNQKLPDAADKEQLLEAQLEQCRLLEEQLAPLRSACKVHTDYAVEQATYIQALEKSETELKKLEAQREQFAACDHPAEPAEAYQRTVDEYASVTKQLQDAKDKRAEHAKKLALLEGELSALRAASDRLADERVRMPEYTKAQYEQAAACIREVQGKQASLVEWQKTQAVAKAELASAQKQLQDVQNVKEQGQRTRDAVQHLTEVRDVFHRNEAPRMVSYTYVETMLGEVNNTLELFEAPFRVEMDEHLGFTANFLDGIRSQPDKRLSVGERILLAMAFRITVNSTFASQVGVLLMDEPTAGLDEHNLGSLPRSLDRLRDLSHERGLQVLFVTHEPRIAHHFDNTIELAAA